MPSGLTWSVFTGCISRRLRCLDRRGLDRPASRPALPEGRDGTFEPTEEQRRIRAAFESRADLLVINAGAGTGKTSTLRYITEDERRRGLYLAFNKRNAKEAARKFGSRVDCRTTHSLAFRALDVRQRFLEKGKRLGGSLPSKMLANVLDIEQSFRDLSPSHTATLAKLVVTRFEHSSDEQISERHCYGLTDIKHFERFHTELKTPSDLIESYARDDLKKYAALVLDYARELWRRKTDPGDRMPMEHDTYLKLWALTHPKLDYDFVMLDEGQDTNAVVLDTFLRQEHQRVIVGDKHQAIYEWRGAINALSQCEKREHLRLNLSQSFRFGQEIADAANLILQLSPDGCDIELSGFRPRDSTIGEVDYPYTCICHTNAGLFGEARRVLALNRRFSVVGGIKDACDQIESVYWLRQDNLTA